MNKNIIHALAFSVVSCIISLTISSQQLSSKIKDIQDELTEDIKQNVLHHLIDEVRDLEQQSLGFRDGQGKIVVSKTDDELENEKILEKGYVFPDEQSSL